VDIPNYGKKTAESEYLKTVAAVKFDTWKMMPIFDGVQVIESLKFERTYDAIVAEAKRLDVDLIVMGSRGVTGRGKWLPGSNAERVIRLSEQPVLVIKEPHSNFEIKRITIASNYYGEFDHAFGAIKPLIELFDAEVSLLKVITPANFEPTPRSRKIMSKFAKTQGLPNYSIHTYNANSVEDGVIGFCKHEKTNLLVMPTHGRTGISHLIFGSTTEDVAGNFHIPILSFKMKEEKVEYGVLMAG
jgi:nucleotide-binding universal stress UspA family protein